jgi:hypothetical protein
MSNLRRSQTALPQCLPHPPAENTAYHMSSVSNAVTLRYFRHKHVIASSWLQELQDDNSLCRLIRFPLIQVCCGLVESQWQAQPLQQPRQLSVCLSCQRREVRALALVVSWLLGLKETRPSAHAGAAEGLVSLPTTFCGWWF